MKRIITFLLSCLIMTVSLCANSFVYAQSIEDFATDVQPTEQNFNPDEPTEPIDPEEPVAWGGDAYLETDTWTLIVKSNNIFADSPKVTNQSWNPGAIRVKVVKDSDPSIQIGSTKIIVNGYSTYLDTIPAFSGTYRILAQAYSIPGSYNLRID